MQTDIIWLIFNSALAYIVLVTFVNLRYNYWESYYGNGNDPHFKFFWNERWMVMLALGELGIHIAYWSISFKNRDLPDDFNFNLRLVYYMAMGCFSTLSSGLYFASTSPKISFFRRFRWFVIFSFIIILFGAASVLLTYYALTKDETYKYYALGANAFFILGSLTFSVLLIRNVCIVEPELDRNRFYSERKEFVKALILIIATLVVIRPLVMLGFSHGYFPTVCLLVPESSPSAREYFLSYNIQDIQMPIFGFLAFSQLMIFIMLKYYMGKEEKMFFVPKPTMDEEYLAVEKKWERGPNAFRQFQELEQDYDPYYDEPL